MDAPVGLEEVRWLQELTYKTPKGEMPEIIGTRLVRRGFIECREGRYSLTPRGLIALAKLA